MDKIFIKNMEIFARHGVLPEETALGQKFIVSAEMECDTREAGRADDIRKSVDYTKVCSLIKRIMTDNTFKLIEAAAEKIAESVLLAFGGVRTVTISVKKPWAPVMTNLETVGVKITRSRHRAYIALGSNMGDKCAELTGAVAEINSNPLCSVLKTSDFIVTKPIGGVEQDDFLNGCIEIETLLSPHELLDFLHEIEDAHHRERKIRWGPRTLDLDIILYDDLTVADETLVIPHPEAHKRSFVLEPLSQIAPYAVFPVKNERVRDMADKIRE